MRRSRVWIDPNRIEDVADAITRADIRNAIESGTIRALPKQGISRGRARYRLAQKAKGRRRGQGSRKGTAGAQYARRRGMDPDHQAPSARRCASCGTQGKITADDLPRFYMKAKGGMFRSKRQLSPAPQDARVT